VRWLDEVYTGVISAAVSVNFFSIFACVLLAPTICSASDSDSNVIAPDKEPIIDGIVDMTMLNFDYYNNFDPTICSCLVLSSNKFNTVAPIPKSLVILVARAASFVIKQDYTDVPPICLVDEPNYEFITECFEAHSKHFKSCFSSSLDMNNKIRCHFLFMRAADPFEHYRAYQAHSEHFKVLMDTVEGYRGLYPYVLLLTHESIDKEYFDKLEEKSMGLEELDLMMMMDLEERWSYFIKTRESTIYHNTTVRKIFTYLATKCRKELLLFVKEYGSAQLHLHLIQIFSDSFQIVPRDFIKCPPCAAPSNAMVLDHNQTLATQENTSNGLYWFDGVLPKDIMYKVFLLAVEDDFFHVLTVFRHVSKSWNDAFTLTDVEKMNSVLVASSLAAKLFISDLTVQLAQKAPCFNVRPWPCLKFEDAFTQVIEMTEIHKDVLCMWNLAKELHLFSNDLGEYEREDVYFRLDSMFKCNTPLLYQDIAETTPN
jgi:hypothetical protein